MNLRDYMKTLDAAQKIAFADRSGTSVGYLNLLSGGHRSASPKLCEKIESASFGLVTKSDLRPDIWPVIQKAA